MFAACIVTYDAVLEENCKNSVCI